MFSKYDSINALGAETTVSSDLIEWVDLIFVMESVHRMKITAKLKSLLSRQKLICLDIMDSDARMDPGLVRLLELKVSQHILLR